MTTITLHQALLQGKQRLAAVEQAQFDVEVLLAFVLKKPRSYLYAWPEKKLTVAQWATFSAYLARRQRQEPLAYITLTREFWSLDLVVSADTLIPRPETEILVQAVLTAYPPGAACRVADLGTGSGAIALALAKERPAWQLLAIDRSIKALAIAQDNAKRLALANIHFHVGTWRTVLAMMPEPFDIIVSNPPYIALTEWETYAKGLAYEPREALVSGGDGLDALREISQLAKHHLKPQGTLFLEHGYQQGVAVSAILKAEGYQSIITFNDLAGLERVTVGRWVSP